MPYTVHIGPCLRVLRTLPDNSVDSVVTDPPYGLSDHKPADVVACLTAWLAGEEYRPKKKGFMGRTWDSWVPGPEVWREVFRVLKPGGHVAAFAAPKNRDLMSTAIRAAGFEVRDEIVDLFSLDDNERRFVESLSPDQSELLARCLDHASDFGMLAWLFGSGFPKSHDISKAIDRALGAERAVVSQGAPVKRMIPGADQHKDGWEKTSGRIYVPTETAPGSESAAQWQGWGTALKPAIEPICLARKPLSEKTVAANVLRWGVGAINVDGCRVDMSDSDAAYISERIGGFNNTRSIGGNAAYHGGEIMDRAAGYDGSKGRWPANLVHDGSSEVVAGFPETGISSGGRIGNAGGGSVRNIPTGQFQSGDPGFGDSGSAARFFYSSKAGGDDRLGSKHPTVKPVDLMRWLVRLITPPGGTVLDPFAGTGTTGHGALLEGFKAIMIERESEYQADIMRRMGLVFAGETERAHAIVKARGEEEAHDTLPLFGGA